MSTDSSHFVLGAFASGYRGDTQSVLPHGNVFYSLLLDFNGKHTAYIVAVSVKEETVALDHLKCSSRYHGIRPSQTY